jgi:alpha-ribazole phosphatase
LVRHGAIELNNSRKFCGFTDVDMTEEGYRQIAKVRDRLATEPIDTVYCSDLKRARRSAEAIVDSRKLEIQLTTDLREMNYGEAEGLGFDEINRRFPEVSAGMMSHSMTIRFPGGDNFEDLAVRVASLVNRIKRLPSDQTVLIVAHTGSLRVLLCLVLEFAQEGIWRFPFDNASLSIVGIHSRGNVLYLFNDTSHLGTLTGPTRPTVVGKR